MTDAYSSTNQLVEMSELESDGDKNGVEQVAETLARSSRRLFSGKVGANWSNQLTDYLNSAPLLRNTSEDALDSFHTDGSYFSEFYQELHQDPLGKEFDRDFFQKLVEEKKKKYHLGQRASEIEVIIDRLIANHGNSVDKALMAVVAESTLQTKTVLLVSKLLYRGADVRAVDEDSRSSLYYAAKRGFVAVAERLLEFGASPTLKDKAGTTPLYISITNNNDKLASLLIKHTNPQQIREMFSRTASGAQPVFSLHELIEKETMKASVLAVLDCLVESIGWTSHGSVVHYSILEADRQSLTPDQDSFTLKDKTCLQLIAQTSDQDYISHPVVRLLVGRKWRAFARMRFTLSAVGYLVALAFLTISVILALESADPSVYDTSRAIDMARISCEGVVLVWLATTLLQEVFEAFKLGKDYLLDLFNYLDVIATIMLALVIPLRIMQMPAQWGVYSMGYLLSVVRVFKFSAISRRLRAYSLIIWRMTSKEFVDFLLMFAVIMLAFTGSFAMALRIDGTLASTNNTKTSNFWNILLTSSRVLIENGPVLNYYDEKGHVYGWYATLLFLTFLFVSMVMLMNILIAQLSDTYESMRKSAQIEVDLNRAWIVARVELNTVPFWCTRPYHVTHYVEAERITSEQLAKFQTETEYRRDNNKTINDIQLEMHDIDLSARSIRNRQRNQDVVLAEILTLLKGMAPTSEEVNNN